MTRKFAEWASEQGPITKIKPSDGCGEKFFSMAVVSGYDRMRFEDYLGNVDLMDNAGALSTTPPAQQQQQDVINRILVA